MTRQRGGQVKHWAEQARVWAWYYAVKQCCAWSDYELDLEFAWTDQGRKDRTTGERPRTFEGIHKVARKPAGRSERWRGMDDLVTVVDQHQRFLGTKALYEAMVWDLFQEKTVAPAIVEDRISKLLEANRLVRCDPLRTPGLTQLIDKHGHGTVFDRCLRLSLRHVDRLSGIALVWSLYQQNEPAHNYQIRSFIEMLIDQLLDDFFRDCLPDQHLTYYTDAMNALLQSRLDFSEGSIAGYGRIEKMGAFPVLPAAMAGPVTERDIFPERELRELLVKI